MAVLEQLIEEGARELETNKKNNSRTKQELAALGEVTVAEVRIYCLWLSVFILLILLNTYVNNHVIHLPPCFCSLLNLLHLLKTSL